VTGEAIGVRALAAICAPVAQRSSGTPCIPGLVGGSPDQDIVAAAVHARCDLAALVHAIMRRHGVRPQLDFALCADR
jgi:hypothetical protein